MSAVHYLTKSVDSKKQLFVVAINNSTSTTKNIDKRLWDVNLSDLSMEVKSNIQVLQG